MTSTIVTVNLIQKLATPHNNCLIRNILAHPEIDLELWYEKDSDNCYGWQHCITNEHKAAHLYGSRINLSFLWQHLWSKNERHIIVGWDNWNTKLLTLGFILTGRTFWHWTDTPHPKPANGYKRFGRKIIYALLRKSRVRMLVTGKLAIQHFHNYGFSSRQLNNFPIFIESDINLKELLSNGQSYRKKAGISDNCFLVTAGSRLILDKGFDLLLEALSLISPKSRSQIRLLLVGQGNEEAKLMNLVRELDLENLVIMKPWLEMPDFQSWIAASQVFVHPARFDAYGGTTLAMSLGVPVVGTYTAGAAVDRIVSGRNGFLYQAEDTQSLASLLKLLLEQPDLRKRMGEASRKTALQWSPDKGVEILYQSLQEV